MTYRLSLFIALVLALGTLAAPAAAQDRLEQDPGYVDLSEMERWFDGEPSLEVNIKGALLKLVAEASRYEDPELARLLERMKAIQVRGFALGWRDYDEISRRTTVAARRLERQGWDTVVRVREDGERVDMYARVVDGVIAGLVVLAIAPGDDDAVFVNIVGDIDPEQIGRIGRRFNIGRLEDL